MVNRNDFTLFQFHIGLTRNHSQSASYHNAKSYEIIKELKTWEEASLSAIKEPADYNNDQDAAAIALAGWPSGTTNLGIAGEWNDIIITSSIYYIVEYDTVKPPIDECTPPVSGINNIEGEFDVKIFPNPANDKFIIYTGETLVQNLKMEIFNINRKLIQYSNLQNSNSNIIDLTGNPSGIYFLKLYINNEIITKKVFLIE